RTDRRDELVEGYRVEDQVAAESVQLERLVVYDGGARVERQDVLFRRLRVHRGEKVHFLLAGDGMPFAGPNRVPGRQAGDVRREHVLAGDRDAHQQDGAQEDQVRRLASGSVDRRDLDAEIVHDPLAAGGRVLFLNLKISR